MSQPTEMPRWRTDDLYAGLDDARFDADLSSLGEQVRDLGELFDQNGIRQGGAPLSAEVLAQAIDAMNSTFRQLGELRAYINAFTSTDSRNAAAQQRMGELTTLALPLSPLRSRLTAWLGSAEEGQLHQPVARRVPGRTSARHGAAGIGDRAGRSGAPRRF